MLSVDANTNRYLFSLKVPWQHAAYLIITTILRIEKVSWVRIGVLDRTVWRLWLISEVHVKVTLSMALTLPQLLYRLQRHVSTQAGKVWIGLTRPRMALSYLVMTRARQSKIKTIAIQRFKTIRRLMEPHSEARLRQCRHSRKNFRTSNETKFCCYPNVYYNTKPMFFVQLIFS